SHRVEHNFFFDGGVPFSPTSIIPSMRLSTVPHIPGWRQQKVPPWKTTSRLFPPPGLMTGLRDQPRLLRSTILISCGSIGGSANRRSVTHLPASQRSTTTPPRNTRASPVLLITNTSQWKNTPPFS